MSLPSETMSSEYVNKQIVGSIRTSELIDESNKHESVSVEEYAANRMAGAIRLADGLSDAEVEERHKKALAKLDKMLEERGLLGFFD